MPGNYVVDSNVAIAILNGQIDLPATVETARYCAELRMQLRQKGKPIPEHDLWIAAAARHYGLIVATRDRHFEGLPGIEIEAW